MRTISDVCNEIMQTMAPQLEEIGMRMILVVSGVTSHEGEKATSTQSSEAMCRPM